MIFHPVTDVHRQIKRALALRSQLSIERNHTGKITDKSDSRGSWRVVLHWLVDMKHKQEWTNQIMIVRRDTGFSEELSFDALFLTADNVKAQLEEYDFPRLLLTTREILQKQKIEEMTHWLSADSLVRQAMTGFAEKFHKPEQCELADRVVRALHDFEESALSLNKTNQVPQTPRTTRKIHIRNFRNLRDIKFDFGSQPVSARVIHGANGTGKSSFCEAISIAMFQSSFRYKLFADRSKEKDVSATNRVREYLDKYIKPVNNVQSEPRIALDDQPLVLPQLVSAENVEEVDREMSGTILTQDTSLEFARMSASELGARVLRGYSVLADRIEGFTESQVNQANTERQKFLRELGLSAAIKKMNTAYQRIAKREIDKSLPPLPHSLIAWLEKAINIEGDKCRELSNRWRSWGGDTGRNELADEVERYNNNRDKLERVIRAWLQQFNDLVLSSTELLRSTEARIGSLLQKLESVEELITRWGEWLEKQVQAQENVDSPETNTLTKRLTDLQLEQKQILELGQSKDNHFQHLTQVEVYIRETWSKMNFDDCPTCGTNHSEQGGILKVVESLRKKTSAKREHLRDKYKEIRVQIDQTQKRLIELGQAQCPLSSAEQSNLTEALQCLIPSNASLSDWIGVKSQRETLLASIIALRQMPTVPVSINIDGEAERVAQSLFVKFHEAERSFETPNNWKPVKDKLTNTLAEIVQKHLPNKLMKLWCELAMNLTSAPWLLLDRPQIDVVAKRGEQRSTISVKGRLARYILNQAEIHILGLAWYFTCYLTYGRFYHAFMVMDDPAHEQDQTSYRHLCRLWETILRLHRVYNRPLKLVLLLNQENRAVEAARATGGILSILEWLPDQEGPINSISIIGEGFHAPQPTILFESTGT